MNRNAQQIKKLLNSGASVYSATFIFRRKSYDSEFEQLNNIITQAANSNKGFLGKESWSNNKENIQSVVYYWDNFQALKEFSNHPKHKKAKQQFNKWYSGYEVIISEVLTFKSNGNKKLS